MSAVGPTLMGWTAPPAPAPLVLRGRWVRLEPLGPEHAEPLYDALCGPRRAPLWTYLGDEMPPSRAAFADHLERRLSLPAVSFCVVPAGETASGLASLMRADPANGTVEVGAVLLGPRLQRTTAATEAMSLLAAHVFGLGYRRLEWKCDSLNEPSRAAARRLGFGYEGTFRNAVVTKGRSRDTAWFAMTDADWERLAPVHAAWLAPAGFADPVLGRGQRSSLSAATARALGWDRG